MKLRLGNGLLPLNLLAAVVLVTIIILPESILRVVVGLPLLLFGPGYALVAAVLPRRGDLDGVERVALSLVMSVAVVPLVALLLNFTPWGIRVYPVAIAIAAVVLVASVAAGVRQRRLPAVERLDFTLSLDWHFRRGIDGMLSAVLAVAILAVVGTLVYVAAVPRAGERFTEFYVLGTGGKAGDYPTQLELGETGRVTLVIVNWEQDTMTYNVEVTIDGNAASRIGPVTLPPGDKWQNEVPFVPTASGDGESVAFTLYRDGWAGPYRSLQLRVSVQ